MSHQPSRPPPPPAYPGQASHRGATYDASEHGYTSPELSPSFLTATVIPSIDDEAETVAHATQDASSLQTPAGLPASSMQATVFGVQRIAPAPAGAPRVPPATPAAQHLAPAVRPPTPTRQPAPPAATLPVSPPNGLSAAAAALADEPTGFLRVPDIAMGPSSPPAGRPPATGGSNWMADQPTSWVALQPGSSDANHAAYAGGGATGTALRRGDAASAALAPSPSSGLRPWLLSLGIGLLGGLLALGLIITAMRQLNGNKASQTSVERRSSERLAATPTDALPAAALDDAMRALQRGDTERAIDILKAARNRDANPALDSLIDSLKRLRGSRLP